MQREHVVPYARKDDRVFVKYAGLDHLERGAKRGAMGADLASINLNEFVKCARRGLVLGYPKIDAARAAATLELEALDPKLGSMG
eukprot:tig00001535_g9292.t1